MPLYSYSWSTGSTSEGQNKLASGATPPYTHIWNNGPTTNILSGLSGGTFVGTITDSKGCPVPATILVLEPDQLAADLSITPVIFLT